MDLNETADLNETNELSEGWPGSDEVGASSPSRRVKTADDTSLLTTPHSDLVSEGDVIERFDDSGELVEPPAGTAVLVPSDAPWTETESPTPKKSVLEAVLDGVREKKAVLEETDKRY